tara:strand:+ start:265 stop:483 length:219 start_codon:yes stop_codon:yes gene_type:complete
MRLRRQSEFIRYKQLSRQQEIENERANVVIRMPENRIAVLMTAQADWNIGRSAYGQDPLVDLIMGMNQRENQ